MADRLDLTSLANEIQTEDDAYLFIESRVGAAGSGAPLRPGQGTS